jgi:branched-chain amino acid transport system permease protein
LVAPSTRVPLPRRSEHPGFWVCFVLVVAVVAVAPLFFPNSFWQRLLTEVLILGLLAMSSDLLIGYVGMVSFGHALFFGTGCYMAAYALMWTESGIGLWLAVLLGLAGAGVMGAFVAYFSTRLREIYFSITTLVFAQIFWVIVFTWTEVTGGENGLVFNPPRLSLPGLFPTELTAMRMHWFVLGVVALAYLIMRRITQSPFGMVLQAIRENEERTRAIGYKVEQHKMMAVMLSALMAGLAGVLYGIFNAYAAPDYFFFFQSGEAIIYNVMGGIGTLVGPVVGAGVFILLKELFSTFWSAEYYLIPVGLLFTLTVMFMPQGLLGFLRHKLNA